MTELPEGRITSGKLQADELQIQLDEQVAATPPAHTETKIDNHKQNRHQWILWWIMIIIAMLTVLNLFTTTITCGPMIFPKITRINLPCILCSDQ